MRTNIVGTTWVWVTWYRSMRARNSSGSKCSMTTDGAADALDGHGEAQRSRVVQRRGRQVHRCRRRTRTASCTGSAAGGRCRAARRAAAPSRPSAGRWCPRSRACRPPRRRRRSGSAGCGRRRPRRTRSRRSSPSSIRRSLTSGIVGRISAAWSALYARGDEGLGAAVVDDVLELADRAAVTRRRCSAGRRSGAPRDSKNRGWFSMQKATWSPGRARRGVELGRAGWPPRRARGRSDRARGRP